MFKERLAELRNIFSDIDADKTAVKRQRQEIEDKNLATEACFRQWNPVIKRVMKQLKKELDSEGYVAFINSNKLKVDKTLSVNGSSDTVQEKIVYWSLIWMEKKYNGQGYGWYDHVYDVKLQPKYSPEGMYFYHHEKGNIPLNEEEIEDHLIFSVADEFKAYRATKSKAYGSTGFTAGGFGSGCSCGGCGGW